MRPLRRLAGGRAPSDPAVFRPVAGAAAERFPSGADGPADAILAGPGSRELGHDLRGRQDPPVGESLADRVAREPPPEPYQARKPTLTAILGVLGVVWRNPRPQNRL